MDLGSDILGSVHLQSSDYGRAVYINCGFSLKDNNDCLPYPKRTDVHMSWRVDVPGKVKLANKPETYRYTTEMIEYERYDPCEIEASLKNALDTWVVPVIKNGMSFILSHDEMYRGMLKIARILHKIPEN